jgi:hypothetical protein
VVGDQLRIPNYEERAGNHDPELGLRTFGSQLHIFGLWLQIFGSQLQIFLGPVTAVFREKYRIFSVSGVFIYARRVPLAQIPRFESAAAFRRRINLVFVLFVLVQLARSSLSISLSPPLSEGSETSEVRI